MKHVQKLAALLLSMAMLASVVPAYAMAAEANTGAVEISSAADLLAFAEKVNAGETTLDATVMTDIDMSEEAAFVGVGTASNPYAGTFNGNGHTITVNMNVSGTYGTNNRTGIISFAGGATVTDVVMAGSIVAYNGAGIVACTVSGENTIENCVNYASIDADFPAGGILGEAKAKTTIRNCTNEGTLGGLSYPHGNENAGIAGKLTADDCLVENCVNNGDVLNGSIAGGNARVGGIVGEVSGKNGIIRNCSNSGTIEANFTVGGIVGQAGEGTLVDNCSNSGKVNGKYVNSGQSGVGGIIGSAAYRKNVRLTNCYNVGEIVANASDGKYSGAAGIIGYVSDTFNAENCFNAGKVTCTGTISHGSVLGNSQRTGNVLTNCYWLEGTDDAMYSGVSQTVSGIVDATSEETMKSADFAASLGEAFVADKDGYPILAWEAAAKPISLVVSGEAETDLEKKTVSFTVSGQNMTNLVTATLTIAVSPETLTDVVAEAAEGWFVMIQNYENGVLTVVVGNNAGANGEGDILTVTGKMTGKVGAATAEVTEAVLSGYDGEGESFLEVSLDGASASTTVNYNLYDVNHDGVVNQLDLTRAQRHYGTADATCDVNSDGEVNIADLILILNHYSAA